MYLERYICIFLRYTHTHTYITTFNIKRAVDFKESKEQYKGRFGERKGKRVML